MQDLILTGIGIAVPSAGLIFGFIKYARKGLFYYKAIKQAVDTFHEVKEANLAIYERVKNDPNRKELATVLSGGIKKIQGLSDIDN